MCDVIRDAEWGYLRLNPLPALDELSSFYESAYYDLLRTGGRAPDLARLLAADEEAERERQWLRETLHQDIIHWVGTNTSDKGLVLDVGSGLGDLMESFIAAGWTAIGLELAEEIASTCRDRGLDVRSETLEDFFAAGPVPQPDVIVLRLVLEHVRDPISLLRSAHAGLGNGGLLVVEVPNDFNAFQKEAQRSLDLHEWWVAVPDHINYFDFDSLSIILRRLGFEVLEKSASFPMELFLLMGEDYVRNREVGAACHARRRELELNLRPETRRNLYNALAEAGLGRTCLFVAAAR